MTNSKVAAVLNMNDKELSMKNKIACSSNWPVCLYDFTVRMKVSNFFIMRVSKPVKIMRDYFGPHETVHDDVIEDLNFIFMPNENENVTIYDSNSEAKRKRIESQYFYEHHERKWSKSKTDKWDDELLMVRNWHWWVYPGFEPHFQDLFDSEDKILFENWTIHDSFGDEKHWIEQLNTFVKEILSSNEITSLKRKEERVIEKKTSKFKSIPFQKHQSFRIPLKDLQHMQSDLKSSMYEQSQSIIIDNNPLKKINSFVIQEDDPKWQALQASLIITQQSILDDLLLDCD